MKKLAFVQLNELNFDLVENILKQGFDCHFSQICCHPVSSQLRQKTSTRILSHGYNGQASTRA